MISLRIDWFDLLAIQGTLRESLAPQFKGINSLALSLLYGPIPTFICDYWKSENENHSVMSNSLGPHGLYSAWNYPGQNTGVGSLSHLQGIFPTQGLGPSLPHCRQILYQLSHKGSQGILEWAAYPFSRGSSQPRNQTGVSCIPALQVYSLPAELRRNSVTE